MYPANQYMDPYYSHCRDHAPYPYYPPPGWEAGHPRMAIDSSSRLPSYGPWPYSGSTSHPRPPELHSCCNHMYPPGYYSFRPPFPQDLPPPHLYYHGPFPHHPNAYPSYFVPPSPYPVDQAPYSFDKFKSHCCGCPNHICHGGEKSNLKIEEEMPEVKPESEQKGANNSGIIRHPNYQYPVMWLPSGDMKDKGNGRSFELPPHLLSRWVPESVESAGDMKQRGEDNQKGKQFQWPIIWMPAGYDEQKKEMKRLKEIDEIPKVSEDAPPSPEVKIIPMSWFGNGHHDQKPAAKDESRDHNESQPASTEHRDGRTMDGNVKTIPVVPKKPNNEKNPVGQSYKTIPVVPDKGSDEKKIGSTYRTIPVVTEKESNEKKSDASENKEGKNASNAEREGENGRRKNVESSKAKHSKLPPVCLRVDPLPRKKSGNGSSRTPSPPTRKDADKNKEDMKKAPSQNLDTKLSDPKKEINMFEVKEKSRGEIDQRMGPRNVTVQGAPVKHTQEEQIPTSMVYQKEQPSVNAEARENRGAKTLQECNKSTKEDEMKIQGEECNKSTKEDEMKIQGEAAKFAKRHEINLPEPDAAICIQSAYRGYRVRRWQPLEKFRKIKNVHEQMQDVKKQLQGLEDSSKQLTVKEQVAINEAIMNLLLKLDTIQGLHPSVREARKSVARELVCLQEKLDSLCKQLSGHSKSEEEKLERIGDSIQTTARVLATGPSEEENFAGVGEEQGPSSINSKEVMHDEVSSRDFTEQKHQIEESSTTKEEAHDEGKAAALGECKGSPLADMMRDTTFSGHSTEQKHQMEESNTTSTEAWPEEEKDVAKGEGQEVSSVSLHNAALSEESSELKQCSASTEHERHAEELHTGVSPAIEDSTTAMAASSMESGVASVKDGPVQGRVQEHTAVGSLALEHEVAPVEEYVCKGPSAASDHLEDSFVSSEDTGAHEHGSALAEDSMVLNPGDQTEEHRDANMQKVADTTQDSAKEQDETPKPPLGDTDNTNHVTTANAENSTQSSLLEEMLQSDSALEQISMAESEATKRCEISCKDDSALVDQQNAPHVENLTGGNENLTGGNASAGEPLAVSLENEAEVMENTLNLAGPPSNIVSKQTLPGSESSELLCEHDGTGVHEKQVSLDSQIDAQKECADGDKTTGSTEATEATEFNEMLEEALACATGENSAELEPDNPKEDAGVQTASEEAASVPAATHDVPKNEGEKGLAEENRKLKEMVQKLLASGNDQMGVVTELSEKVKTLERKLTRKKRPKLRVQRPVRNTTAKAH